MDSSSSPSDSFEDKPLIIGELKFLFICFFVFFCGKIVVFRAIYSHIGFFF